MKIYTYPDPILRKKAEEVKTVDETLRELVDDMAEAMYGDDGVGLAAPQIGISKRVIVVDGGKGFMALFNPEIVRADSETDTMEEGCLSLPGIRIQVTRPVRIVLRALTIAGEHVEWEAEGLMARIFQHEIDHLNGVLIIDRASSVHRSLLQSKLRKLKKEASQT